MIKFVLYTSAIVLQIAFLNAAQPKVKTLEIGAKAPAFSLAGTDGKTYTLDSFKEAKILVLVFTSNHCPDARAARQRINTVARNYKEKGVQVVAISGNDPKALLHWELGYSVYGDGFDAMKEVAKYTFPQLRATEVTAEVTDGRDKSDAIRDVESILARRSSGLPESSDRSELH